MGRKKIEIQPITHERNRSVTFLKSWQPDIYNSLTSTSPPTPHPSRLKRKNGLFKKAYELGVLCSVDVAVIIFEERPGHHVKLYQYCSGDINDIVQRHLRHDGEKDHKGPADFSGNNNPKIDDTGEDNDDDGEEDEELPSRNKRGRDGKLKPQPDMHVGGIDYSHRSLAIPQAPSLSMHGISPQNAGPGLPISSDRLSNIRNSAKRGRLEIHPHSRSPSDDPSNPASYYHPASPFAAARQPPSYQHSPHHQGNPQYTPFFSQPSTPSFIQSGGAGHSSRAGPGYGLPHHASASTSGSYDSAPVYPSIMGRTSSAALTGSTSTGSSGGSLFPPFLDTDEQGRHHQHPQTQQTGFGGLEWPVHATGNSSTSGAHSSLPESVSNPQPSSTDSGGQSSSSHWLDFLSSSNSAPSASTAREIMSWERGGGPPSSNPDLYVERGRPGTAGSPLIAGILNAGKRSPGGLLTSPLTGANGRDGGNKDSIPPG